MENHIHAVVKPDDDMCDAIEAIPIDQENMANHIIIVTPPTPKTNFPVILNSFLGEFDVSVC